MLRDEWLTNVVRVSDNTYPIVDPIPGDAVHFWQAPVETYGIIVHVYPKNHESLPEEQRLLILWSKYFETDTDKAIKQMQNDLRDEIDTQILRDLEALSVGR